MTKISAEQFQGIVRHVLTFGGGYLLAKGLFNQAQLDILIPAVVSLAGVGWSMLSKSKVGQ